MSEFLAMDGYASFVWSAYGLTALGVAILVAHMVRSRSKAQARLEAAEEQDEIA
jgi:heme exporter protein CcmD